MILYFDDAVSLTGAKILPHPMTLVYPSSYTLNFTCMTGLQANQPVDIEALGCTEWKLSVRTGFTTSAVTLLSNKYDGSCVEGNVFTLQLNTNTLPVYTFIAGRRRAMVVFCLKGMKEQEGIMNVAVAIQFIACLQSTGDDIEPPQMSDYDELTNLPSIDGVEIKGSKIAKDYGLVAQTTNMPMASPDLLGSVYVYVGEDSAQYQRGHMYLAAHGPDSPYWEDITIYGGTSKLDYTIIND